jgi:hypothetical protein
MRAEVREIGGGERHHRPIFINGIQCKFVRNSNTDLMKNNLFSLSGFAVVAAFLLSSCGTIEVSKRRHLPGYHVVLGSHKQHARPQAEPVAKSDMARQQVVPMAGREAQVEPSVSSLAATEMTETSMTSATIAPTASFSAPTSVERPVAIAAQSGAESLFSTPSKRFGSELRRSVFAEEGDEKHGWSVAAIMAFAFGTLAFILMLVAIVSMIGLGPLWFLPAIFGFIFGLAGLITGAIGLKQTRAGGRKGRGFAIAGLISGVIGMVISLVALLIGFVRTIAN